MGSGNSTSIGTNLSLQFSEKTKKFYRTDEIVSGTIEWSNDGDSDVTLKSITVELVGELVYRIDKRSNKQRSSATHRMTFFTKILNLCSTDNENKIILTPGNYSWSFSFDLDNSLPPTMKQIHYQGPYIHYFLCARLEQSDLLKKNITERYPIIFQQSSTSLRLTHLEVQDENRNGVHMHVFCHKNVAVAGERLSLQLNLENPNQKIIHRISAKLIQERILGSTKEKNVIPLAKNLINVYNFQEEYLYDDIKLLLPKNTVASFSWRGKSKPSQHLLSMRYWLRLEAHMYDKFNNICLQVPLTIINTISTNEDEIIPLPTYESLFPV
ncbi:unnamed protein product [Rotaria sp. Silwood2]|nr:unnamed protein product [Rotaria sp. Silwood2]CAF4385066.1 unnamed protein product [Rotaria sp. Silwood2]